MSFKLYRKPQIGEMVVIGADPADTGSDYCAAHALSKKSADQVMVFHERTDSSQFGHELFKMAKYIHKETGEYPIIAVERNTGMATISALQLYNYPKLYRMKRLGTIKEGVEERIGFSTNVATRPMILDGLALALKQKAIRVYDSETVRELMSFIKNATTGKPEAATGSHDDLLMSLAIALHLFGDSTPSQSNLTHTNIRMFPKQELFDSYGIPNV
jgi:hypothetical protein